MDVKLKTNFKEILKTKNTDAVKQMFDDIAPKYDLLNHLLSFNIDKYWRKKTIAELKDLKNKGSVIIDLATGTGDLAKAIVKNLMPGRLIAIDVSESMLKIAAHKLNAVNADSRIKFKVQAAECLDVPHNTIDAVTIAFGVRNFNNLHLALQNIYSVLKPNAKVVIIEFSKPKNRMAGYIYKCYFSKLLPFIGRLISGHGFAYNYLIDSVQEFPSGKNFLTKMHKAGFSDTYHKPLTFGICSIYVGYKRQNTGT